jgi:hypothetical protein
MWCMAGQQGLLRQLPHGKDLAACSPLPLPRETYPGYAHRQIVQLTITVIPSGVKKTSLPVQRI